MSPIAGVSNVRRLPRLGKVRLGIKVEGVAKSPYPQATDFFVCPPEVAAVYGPKPTKLDILFPVEDDEIFAQQWYRCYSGRWGLVCKGDGQMADRTLDADTGCLAGKDTKQMVRKEVKCPGPDCPDYQRRQCRPMMFLQFILPKVPGLGIWQLDTSSYNSIKNVNAAIDMVRSGCGRVAFIPLVLELVPATAAPVGLPKKTIHVLRLSTPMTFPELVLAAERPLMGKMLMPTPVPPEEEEVPDDHYPAEVLAEAEEQAAAADSPGSPAVREGSTTGDPAKTDSRLAEQRPGVAEPPLEHRERIWPDDCPAAGQRVPPRDPQTLHTLGQFFTATMEDFKLNKTDTLKKLEISNDALIGDLAEAYMKVWATGGGV